MPEQTYPQHGPMLQPEALKAQLLPDLAPHLAHVATFALHLGAKCDPLYRHWWFVSNVETGCMVAYDTDKIEAIRKASERLAKKSVTDIRAAYRRKECRSFAANEKG